jgi:hypothetical protein
MAQQTARQFPPFVTGVADNFFDRRKQSAEPCK